MLSYAGSVEVARFQQAAAREKQSFASLIQRKAHLALPVDAVRSGCHLWRCVQCTGPARAAGVAVPCGTLIAALQPQRPSCFPPAPCSPYKLLSDFARECVSYGPCGRVQGGQMTVVAKRPDELARTQQLTAGGSRALAGNALTRRAGGGALTTRGATAPRRIVVDVREFMSALPAVLHGRGLEIAPVTLEVCCACKLNDNATYVSKPSFPHMNRCMLRRRFQPFLSAMAYGCCLLCPAMLGALASMPAHILYCRYDRMRAHLHSFIGACRLATLCSRQTCAWSARPSPTWCPRWTLAASSAKPPACQSTTPRQCC